MTSFKPTGLDQLPRTIYVLTITNIHLHNLATRIYTYFRSTGIGIDSNNSLLYEQLQQCHHCYRRLLSTAFSGQNIPLDGVMHVSDNKD
jgi:hypothetical protein